MTDEVHAAAGIRVEPLDHSFELFPGLTIHRQAKVTLTGYRGYDVTAKLTVNDAGKPEVSSLTVEQREGGPAVTGVALRSIAVQSVAKAYIKVEAAAWLPVEPGTRVVAFGILKEEEAQRLKELGPVPETLEAVSKVYRLAEFLDEPPVKAVEGAFSIPRGTAGAWIGRARSAGLIPPAKDGTDGQA